MGMCLHRDSGKYCFFFEYFESYKLKIGFLYIESDIYIGFIHVAKKMTS